MGSLGENSRDMSAAADLRQEDEARQLNDQIKQAKKAS